MDLIEGRDLNSQLREQGEPGLPLEEVIDYAHQAAEALSYVHGQNVVHRDVKPHNFVLGEDGLVLVDFGVAREEELEDGGTRAMGTPLYMAPEVMVGEEVSARSDVYGLAATIWALLLGKPPAYEDPTPLAEEVPGRARGGAARGAGHPARAPPGLGDRAGRRPRRLAARRRGPLAGAEHLRHLGTQRPAGGDRPHGRWHLRRRGGLDRPHRRRYRRAGLPVGLGRRGARDRGGAPAAGPGPGRVGGGQRRGAGDPRLPQRLRASPPTWPARSATCPTPCCSSRCSRPAQTIGVLSILDRRDGGGYKPADVERGMLFGDLSVTALDA